jgi:hypothetical protein
MGLDQYAHLRNQKIYHLIHMMIITIQKNMVFTGENMLDYSNLWLLCIKSKLQKKCMKATLT